ncbi:MAG: choice-of-anchor R domain-containing protein [Bryobacteraceae bacterium]
MILGLCLVANASPVVLFNNFGPGDTFDTGTGWTLGGGGVSGNEGDTQGFVFTPGATAQLSMIELAVGRFSGANELTVWLMSDAAGQPGASLESFVFSGAMTSFGSTTIISANSVSHPLLNAGTQYWLIGAPPDLINDWDAWNMNSITALGPRAIRIGAGSWSATSDDTQGAFRITGETAAVPEPSAFLFLGAGLIWFGLLPRRKA